jgi:hypothetical protein
VNGRGLRERVRQNPFYVLGLSVDCRRIEVEREGQRLLAELELRLEGAQTYSTPLGQQPRTPELVREAMAELRDPAKRILHALLAALPAEPLEDGRTDSSRAWSGAPRAFGFGRRGAS